MRIDLRAEQAENLLRGILKSLYARSAARTFHEPSADLPRAFR